MLTKTQLISSLDKTPENLPIDQLVDQRIFVKKVQKGLSHSLDGNIKSKEEAKQKPFKWL
jgi:hypothetical protein